MTRIYKTQEAVEKDIKDGVLNCNYEDVKFECNINIRASIINASDISAHDINAYDISASGINAHDINAYDINAGDIDAYDISAYDISYYAFLTSYKSIKCKSWKKRRDNAHDPICLDGKLEIIDHEITELTLEQIAEKFGKDVKNIKIKK
jgi:hypothetical protein